jgi:hypothetical protein
MDEFNLLVSGYESQGLYRYKTISEGEMIYKRLGESHTEYYCF